MMRGSMAVLVGLATAGLCLPAAAGAQVQERRWQVEGFGGLSLFDLPASGDAALPPAGPPLLTSGPTNPSRRVPTWFLGDGASLLNGTNAEFGVASRIAPLDAALSGLGLSGSNAPAAGLRARRQITSRWSLEAGVELHAGALDLDPVLLDAVEQARASFETAFTGLFTSGPFTNITVSAGSEVTGTSSRELLFSGAVRYSFSAGTFTPYLTAGGGVIQRLGDLPRVELTGDYQFTVATSQGQATFTEADSLTLRYEQGANVVGIVGAGVQRGLTDRLGFSVDGRAYLGQQTLTLRLDSAPTVTTRTPAAFIESFTTPAVQFSNNSSTGRDSTLSGTPLNGFKAFTTSGLQIRYVVTAGLFVRF